MLVGMVPTSVFADTAEQEQTVSTAPVIEAEAPARETEPPAPETKPTVPATEASETEAAETQAPETRETEAPTEVTEATEATVALLEETAEPAADVNVTFTVSNQGVLAKTSDGEAAVELPVTVKDLDADGILTYDEALVALHAAYCPGGYNLNGTSVTKLWGVDTVGPVFRKNSAPLDKAVNYKTSTVAEGDKLYAASVTDRTDLSDCAAWFDRTQLSVKEGESFTLNLKAAGEYFSGNASTGLNAYSVPVGTWEKGSFQAIDGAKTDASGNVTLSFDKAGTYIVTAKGTVPGEIDDGWDTTDIDCTITAPYCVVTVTAAQAPVTYATVTLRVQEDGDQVVTAFDEKVPSNLAESYGYTDQVTDGVSALDVLVRAHELVFFDQYDKTNATEWLAVNDQGWITMFLGEESIPVCMMVNGAAPGDGSATVNQAKVEDGDFVFFGVYEDATGWSDQYVWLETVDGKRLDGQEFYAGTDLELVVKGVSAAMPGTAVPVAGATLSTVDKKNGNTQKTSFVSDGSGKITIPLPAEKSNSEWCFTVQGKNMFGELSAFTVGAVAQESDLVEIHLGIGRAQENTIRELTLTPEFDHTIKTYKVDPLDYVEDASERYLWVKVDYIEDHCTASFNFHGLTKTFTKAEDRQWKRLDKLTPGEDNVLTLTSVPETGLTKTYTLTVPMKAPAADADVTFTVSIRGVLAKTPDGAPAIELPVTVKDLDKDGTLTYHEALAALHEAYCPGGYAAELGSYGTGYVTTFWGEAATNCLFFQNGTAPSVGVMAVPVAAGDKLYASRNADDVYYADVYTYFDQTHVTVEADTNLTLTLKGAAGMSEGTPAAEAMAGVSVGTWVNGAFQPIAGKTTDNSGKVVLSFQEPGTYYVTAQGTVKSTAWSGEQVDAPTMAPYCVVTVTPSTAVKAMVSFSGQMAGAFVFPPAVDTEVSSKLAESYGYTDKVDATKDVSTLDVLVKAHELTFGADFTADTASDYLELSGSMIKKIFGVSTYNICILVNGVQPGNGTETVDQAKVVTGNDVLFAIYQSPYYADEYAWLETADGAKLNGQSLEAGSKVTLVAKSRTVFDHDPTHGDVLEGAQVLLVNMETGETTALGTTDEEGKSLVTIPVSLANTAAYLTVNVAVEDPEEDTCTFMSLSKVQVTPAENSLTSLEVAVGGSDEASRQILTLTPDFDKSVTKYTTSIADYVADSSQRSVWVKVTASSGTTVSCKTSPYFWDPATVLPAGQWTELITLNTGTYNTFTLTLSKSDVADGSCSITVPMQPDTANQSLSWKTNLKSLVYFRPNAQAALTVAAQHNNRPLDSEAVIAYQWYEAASVDAEGTAIAGATQATYNPETIELGTRYYYAVASCEGTEPITSNVITVKVTDEKAPTSVTLISDYPYTLPNTTWDLALDGKDYYATKGDQIHVRAVDENGNDTPVEWTAQTNGSTFDAKTGILTVVSYSGNNYLTATSLVDPTVTSGEKCIVIGDYKFSDYQRNQTVSLTNGSCSLSGGVNGHNTWTLNIPEGVAACTGDLSKKPQSLSFAVYRPGVFTVTFTTDLGGEKDPRQTDTATITVTGVGVETTDGIRSRVDMEMSEKVPNPTVSLTTYLMEGRTLNGWKSSDDTVASVDENGVVTAKAIGTATITATDSEGTTGSITIVVTDAAMPTMEALAFSRGWGYGVNGLNFQPTTFEYTGLTLSSATSKLEFAATTKYSDKLEAVATYVDEKGTEQTVAVASGKLTNLLPNIAFGTNTLTLTLTRKDNKDVKSVYTFEITRPRDATNPMLTNTSGMVLLAGDGAALRADLYNGKAEGFLFNAQNDGTLIGSNYSFSGSTYYYRAYMLDARDSFKLNTKASNAYAHLRYSLDDGETWTELPQGGGMSDTILFPEPLDGNPVVKVIVQLVNDKTYTDNENAFPETVARVYTVWVEQLPSVDAIRLASASTDKGDWYPAFDPDHSDYSVSVAYGETAPVLTFAPEKGLKVSMDNAELTPDEDGNYTLTMSTTRQTVTLSSSDGTFQRNYTFRYRPRVRNGADKMLDALCINSQYTNVSYGAFPESSLGGDLKSLGNFGGYAVYYFEQGLTDNPQNRYGVDFYIDGNAFVDTTTGQGTGSMEPGQVWVSENGSTWYALAGSEHYSTAIWDYAVTYTRNGDGTYWKDNYGNTVDSSYGRSFKWPLTSAYPLNDLIKNDSFTLSGILIPSNKGIVGNDDFGTLSSGARFGYVDTLPNGRNNPYLDNRDYKNESSGFDLAWAVDAAGNPVDVSGKSFHYVKVVTASNIVAGAANEKSTEVLDVLRAESTGADVGKTSAQGITVLAGGESYPVALEEGKQIYTVGVPADEVTIQVNGNAENTYVNNQWIPAGKTSEPIGISADKTTLVRVIVQSGDEEPSIYLLKLSKRESTDVDIDAATELLSGKSTTLRVLDENGNVIKNVSWALQNPDDSIYATITSAGVVKAKTVPTRRNVVFVATLPGEPVQTRTHTVTIIPTATQLEIHTAGKNVTGKTLTMKAAENETILLSGIAYPEDAIQAVTWKSSNTKVLTVDSNGKLTYKAGTGTVTVTATTTDGSKRTATVKIQVGILTEKVEIVEPETTTLRAGKSVKLTAKVTPENPTVSGVTYQLVNASDSAYVTIKNNTVTAKSVNEPHAVKIIAVSKDAAQVKSEPILLVIQPKSDRSVILKVGRTYVTKTTLVRNAGDSIALKAYTLDVSDAENPEQEAQVTWKSSKPKVADVDEKGNVTCLTKGTATISALVDGKVQATVNVTVTTLVEDLTIASKTGSFTVASGKSLTLTAGAEPANAANKKVTWTITSGSSYAKLSASGVLTANKNLTAPVTVTVKAEAKDGSGIYAEQAVRIIPIVQAVSVFDAIHERSTSKLTLDMTTNPTLKLYAEVYPGNASQSVKWTSSNAKIASVDENGLVTCLKTGKVSITATAQDGSGKKASFSLTIVKTVSNLTLPETAVIAGGKALTLKTAITPADATNKKLSWSVSENDAKITVNASGKLSTKAVTAPVTVTVTVQALDGSGTTASCQVTVYPATTKVQITAQDGGALPGTLNVGDQVTFKGRSVPENTASRYTWKTSNAKLATVDENGTVTAVKAGTVTVTCTAADGTNKSASFKLKIVEEPVAP